MKKTFISVVSVFVLGILLTTGSMQAYAAYQCSTGESQCVDAAFGPNNTKKIVTSNSIWFSKGDIVTYQWENEPTGQMQVAFYIYNSEGKQVTPRTFAHSPYH